MRPGAFFKKNIYQIRWLTTIETLMSESIQCNRVTYNKKSLMARKLAFWGHVDLMCLSEIFSITKAIVNN